MITFITSMIMFTIFTTATMISSTMKLMCLRWGLASNSAGARSQALRGSWTWIRIGVHAKGTAHPIVLTPTPAIHLHDLGLAQACRLWVLWC